LHFFDNENILRIAPNILFEELKETSSSLDLFNLFLYDMSLFSTKNISTKKPHLRNILGIFAILLVGSILLLMVKISLVGANWMWGNFLNQDFWNQQANTGNILYATFGDGTPGSTPYTRLWTTSCMPNNVQVLPSSFVGGSLQANTIYLINS
jgi:hypothetical protein